MEKKDIANTLQVALCQNLMMTCLGFQNLCAKLKTSKLNICFFFNLSLKKLRGTKSIEHKFCFRFVGVCCPDNSLISSNSLTIEDTVAGVLPAISRKIYLNVLEFKLDMMF